MKKMFNVVGSHGDPYTVTFSDESGSLHAHCTCPSGWYGKICKHILKCIEEDPDIYQSMKKSGISDYYDQYLAKTAEAEKIKKEAASYKNAFARILLEDD